MLYHWKRSMTEEERLNWHDLYICNATNEGDVDDHCAIPPSDSWTSHDRRGQGVMERTAANARNEMLTLLRLGPVRITILQP